MDFFDKVLYLFCNKGIIYFVMLMFDGLLQFIQIWVDIDGEFVIINMVDGYQKVCNICCDLCVVVMVVDLEELSDFVQLCGQVVCESMEGVVEYIELFFQCYMGQLYVWWGGCDQVWVMLYICVDKVGVLW